MQNALMQKYIDKNKREKALPAFRPGDTIKVHVKIKEGDKERLQAFEGTLIARNGTGMGESITVRKVSFGQGVERIFPVNAKVVDHIELAKPDFPGMEHVHFGGDLDLINEPGQHISIFNSEDPVVHNKVFGLGRFDLNTRQIDFNPIGPVPGGIAGLQVTADKKWAYTVVANGMHGNKRCEFWAFDLTTDRITQKAEVPCRTRFTLGISNDGKKLYIYGAGFEIEVYDAVTLKYEKTWTLDVDVTYAGIVVTP